METGRAKWICAQLGAREHYAVPRALHRNHALLGLFTDAWVRPGQPLGHFRRSLRERYHADLADATVLSATASLLAFEARSRLQGLAGWDRILARNAWFQRQALRSLRALRSALGAPPTLFAYSYAAHDLFQWARAQGWRTVLGQIDPGAAEFRLVAEEMARHPHLAGPPPDFPAVYYEHNRREWELADVIVVNSEWSRAALLAEGANPAKIELLPLAYEAEAGRQKSEVSSQTSDLRSPISGPLRVLWLGQVNVRKGIHYLMEAARLLNQNLVAADVRRLNLEGNQPPVHFDIVGPIGILPAAVASAPKNMTFHGPVSRDCAVEWYRRADVFVLPTLSDGFALTQLEALAHGLPVIATPHCGRVVADGKTGFIVPARDSQALAAAILNFARDRNLSPALAPACREAVRAYSVAAYGRQLMEAVGALGGRRP